MKFVESKPDAPSHTSAGAWEFGAPKPGRSDRDPALGIETDSAESPPRYAKGVGTGARPANDKAPVTFDEGLELRIHNLGEPILPGNLGLAGLFCRLTRDNALFSHEG